MSLQMTMPPAGTHNIDGGAPATTLGPRSRAKAHDPSRAAPTPWSRNSLSVDFGGLRPPDPRSWIGRSRVGQVSRSGVGQFSLAVSTHELYLEERWGSSHPAEFALEHVGLRLLREQLE